MVISLALTLWCTNKNFVQDINNPTILGMTLSIAFLSLSFGPLVSAPLSELYGRTWVNATNYALCVAEAEACLTVLDLAH